MEWLTRLGRAFRDVVLTGFGLWVIYRQVDLHGPRPRQPGRGGKAAAYHRIREWAIRLALAAAAAGALAGLARAHW